MSVRKISAEGQVFAMAGRLTKFKSYNTILRKVAANNATMERSISEKVTVLVAGVRPGSKATQAMTRGALIITEAQFVELLEHGEVEIQTREVEKDLNLEKVIGELRSILSQPAISSAWTAIVEMLEKCDEDRLPEVVAYLSHQLTDWGRDVRWKIKKDHALFKDFAPAYWTTSNPTTQLCVAPPIWMLEALRGDMSERHKLARALNLEGLKLNGGLGKKLLEHEGWQDIRALVLGIQNRFSKGFYTYLAQSDIMQTIEELWVYQYTPSEIFMGVELNEDSFPMLKRVVCNVSYPHDKNKASREAFLTKMRDETPWISSEVKIEPWSF